MNRKPLIVAADSEGGRGGGSGGGGGGSGVWRGCSESLTPLHSSNAMTEEGGGGLLSLRRMELCEWS